MSPEWFQGWSRSVAFGTLPVGLQRLGVRLLAPLGRRLGYSAEYPEYVPKSGRLPSVSSEVASTIDSRGAVTDSSRRPPTVRSGLSRR